MSPTTTGNSGLSEFRCAWRPLLACAVGLGFGLSPVQPYAAGIMASALGKAFGWPRAEILFALLTTPAALLLLGRPIGRLVDRIGARKVAIASTIGLGFGQLLLAAIATSLPAFYIASAFLSAVSLGTLPVTYAKVVSGWFVEARGLALGLALAATGISGAAFPFVLTNAIDRYGWRGGYVALAALPLCIALPILFAWLRERPAIMDADHVAAASPNGSYRAEVRQVIRSRRFFTLAFASFLLSFGVSGLLPNLFPILLDRGLSAARAAPALAAMAISVTVGRILSGWLLDRLWAPIVASILIIPSAIALALMMVSEPAYWMLAGPVIMLGLVAGAEFDLVAFMTARYFGQRHFSELYGIQFAAFGVAAGLAPSFYSIFHDHSGGYNSPIELSIALLMTASLLYFTLGQYPTKRSNDFHL
jgi:MFS family permease